MARYATIEIETIVTATEHRVIQVEIPDSVPKYDEINYVEHLRYVTPLVELKEQCVSPTVETKDSVSYQVVDSDGNKTAWNKY